MYSDKQNKVSFIYPIGRFTTLCKNTKNALPLKLLLRKDNMGLL
jgi:hypothetical protein